MFHGPCPDRFLWQIPLTYVTSASSTVQRYLLKTKTGSRSRSSPDRLNQSQVVNPRLPADVLLLPQEVDWVKFNVDMSGYYMVHYADGGWDAIVDLLQSNHTVLSGNDRASLIHDVFQLVGSVRPSGRKSRNAGSLADVSRALLCSCCSVGKVRLDTALELSLYLSRETATMAVTQGFQELVPLYKLMEKRDMAALEDKMKVWTEAETDLHHTLWTSLVAILLLLLLLCLFRATSWICSGT